MSLFTNIIDIPPVHERALIINVHTLLCTTLAILSAKRYMDMPLLVVDCPLNGKSDWKELERLQQDYDFDLLALPLRPHGDTLDDLFTHLSCDWIYLVDSDVEVLNAKGVEQIRWMRQHSMISTDRILGVGLKQVSGFGLPPQERVYHAERMWIPFCALQVSAIKEAIMHGESFNITSKNNYGKIGGGGRKMRNRLQRYGMCRMATIVDRIMDICRYQFKGRGIDLTLYDTGASLYEWLQQHGFIYLDYSFYVYAGYVEHFCGVTRQCMYENEQVCTSLTDIESVIKGRLIDKYNFDFEQYYE